MVSAVSNSSATPIVLADARTAHRQQASLITASGAVKVVAGALLFAGAMAGTGRLLQLGGAQMVAHSPALQDAGRAALVAGDQLFLVGKGAFLSVSVPIYTSTWTVPKWIVTEGAPKGAALAYKYVFIPAYKKLLEASLLFNEAMIKAAQAIYTFALLPLGRAFSTAVVRIWNAVVLPSMEAAVRAIHRIYQSILQPLALAAAHAARQVLKAISPSLDACRKAIQVICEQVLKPLGRILAQVLQWIWNAVFLRCINAVKNAIQAMFHQYLKPLLQLIASVAKSAWTAILPMVEASNNLIAKTALAFYSAILEPACRALSLASKWIWQAAVIPAAQFALMLQILVEKVLTAIRQDAIAPLGQFVRDAIRVT